ncbi:hypothetical protein OH77DRAFT_624597 [Trametes cingulata]|nr:hypothetical protein OH77DRAFT_624597 [Trametes cingulata]
MSFLASPDLASASLAHGAGRRAVRPGPLLLEQSTTRGRGRLRSPGEEFPKTIDSIYALAICASPRGQCLRFFVWLVCQSVVFPASCHIAQSDIDLSDSPSIGIEFCPVAGREDDGPPSAHTAVVHSMRSSFRRLVCALRPEYHKTAL